MVRGAGTGPGIGYNNRVTPAPATQRKRRDAEVQAIAIFACTGPIFSFSHGIYDTFSLTGVAAGTETKNLSLQGLTVRFVFDF